MYKEISPMLSMRVPHSKPYVQCYQGFPKGTLNLKKCHVLERSIIYHEVYGRLVQVSCEQEAYLDPDVSGCVVDTFYDPFSRKLFVIYRSPLRNLVNTYHCYFKVYECSHGIGIVVTGDRFAEKVSHTPLWSEPTALIDVIYRRILVGSSVEGVLVCRNLDTWDLCWSAHVGSYDNCHLTNRKIICIRMPPTARVHVVQIDIGTGNLIKVSWYDTDEIVEDVVEVSDEAIIVRLMDGSIAAISLLLGDLSVAIRECKFNSPGMKIYMFPKSVIDKPQTRRFVETDKDGVYIYSYKESWSSCELSIDQHVPWSGIGHNKKAGFVVDVYERRMYSIMDHVDWNAVSRESNHTLTLYRSQKAKGKASTAMGTNTSVAGFPITRGMELINVSRNAERSILVEICLESGMVVSESLFGERICGIHVNAESRHVILFGTSGIIRVFSTTPQQISSMMPTQCRDRCRIRSGGKKSRNSYHNKVEHEVGGSEMIRSKPDLMNMFFI